MSFAYTFKKLRGRISYDSRTEPEMSAHEEGATGEVETGIIEGNEGKRLVQDSLQI